MRRRQYSLSMMGAVTAQPRQQKREGQPWVVSRDGAKERKDPSSGIAEREKLMSLVPFLELVCARWTMIGEDPCCRNVSRFWYSASIESRGPFVAWWWWLCFTVFFVLLFPFFRTYLRRMKGFLKLQPLAQWQ